MRVCGCTRGLCVCDVCTGVEITESVCVCVHCVYRSVWCEHVLHMCTIRARVWTHLPWVCMCTCCVYGRERGRLLLQVFLPRDRGTRPVLSDPLGLHFPSSGQNLFTRECVCSGSLTECGQFCQIFMQRPLKSRDLAELVVSVPRGDGHTCGSGPSRSRVLQRREFGRGSRWSGDGRGQQHGRQERPANRDPSACSASPWKPFPVVLRCALGSPPSRTPAWRDGRSGGGRPGGRWGEAPVHGS